MNEQRTIVTQRDIIARLVPSGTQVEVPKGSFANLRQSLGGSYTVTINGNMVRIDGTDADAIGQEPLAFDFHEPNADGSVNMDDVWSTLDTIFDPEIPVSIVSLGLIYACDVIRRDDQNVMQVRMTLTAPGCGMGEVLAGDVQDRVIKVPNVDKVEVEMVFDPPWSRDMISEEGLIELGLF